MFAETAPPSHQLLAKCITFDWSPECQQAFEDLKGKLVSLPVLASSNFDKSFVLETDDSIQGLGAVLSPKQADGKLHPVAYASRFLSNNKERYAITNLETLQWSGPSSTVSIISMAMMSPYAPIIKQSRRCSAARIHQGSMHIGGARSTVLAFALSTSPTSPGKNNTNADALSQQRCQLAPADNTASPFVQVASILTDAEDAQFPPSLVWNSRMMQYWLLLLGISEPYHQTCQEPGSWLLGAKSWPW